MQCQRFAKSVGEVISGSNPHSKKHRLLSVFPFHTPDRVFPTFIFFFFRLPTRLCRPLPEQLVFLPSVHRFVTVVFPPSHATRAHYRSL